MKGDINTNTNIPILYHLSHMQVIVYLMNLLKKHLSRSTLGGKLIEVGNLSSYVSACLPACLPACLFICQSVISVLSIIIFNLCSFLVTLLASHPSLQPLSVYLLFFVLALLNNIILPSIFRNPKRRIIRQQLAQDHHRHPLLTKRRLRVRSLHSTDTQVQRC